MWISWSKRLREATEHQKHPWVGWLVEVVALRHQQRSVCCPLIVVGVVMVVEPHAAHGVSVDFCCQVRQSHEEVLLVAGEYSEGLAAVRVRELGVMSFAAACTVHEQEMVVEGAVLAMVIEELVVAQVAVVVKTVVATAVLVMGVSLQTYSLQEVKPFLQLDLKVNFQTDFRAKEKGPEKGPEAV